MNYIISDEELVNLKQSIKSLMENEYSCGDCGAFEIVEEIESKKPVTCIAEGIFGKCSGVVNSINDVEIWNGDKLIEKLEGKRAKLYLEEI